MASLETLPAPLPLIIIKLLSDIKALDSLCRASPVCMNVFEQHAAEIIEQVIPKTLQVDVAREFRVSTIIIAEGTSKLSSREEREALYTKANLPLPRTTSAKAIVHTLRGFSYDHALGDLIMRGKLQTLYTLPHEHIGNRYFRYGQDSPDKLFGRPYQVPEPSAPHWIEEQRVARLMLRRRIFQLLQETGVSVREVSLYDGFQTSWCDFEKTDGLNDGIKEINDSEKKLSDAGLVNLGDRYIPISWTSPASVPDLDDPFEKPWNDKDTTPRSAQGQFEFYYTAAFMGGSPLHRSKDWPVLRRLGLGIWSNRRLGIELQLLNVPELYRQPLFGPSGNEYLPRLRRLHGHASEVYVMHKLVEAATKAESEMSHRNEVDDGKL